MLRVSVSKNLVIHKPFFKELFDLLTFDRLSKTGTVRFSKVLVQAVDKAVEAALNEILLHAIKQNLVRNDSVFRQVLINELRFVNDGPGRVALTTGAAKEYANILERGSKPRAVDAKEVDNLVTWVIFKQHLSGARAKKAAANIAKVIARTGNKPHPYIAPAFEATMSAVQQSVQTQLREVIGT